MKSIYLRNFAATATMVFFCFLIFASVFVGIGRNYVISEYRQDMVNSANEVSRTASAIAQSDSLSSWVLSMSISSIASSTGNQVFITDENGTIISCSDRAPVCEHMGVTLAPEIINQLRLNGSLDKIGTLGGLYKSSRYIVAKPVPSAGDGETIGYVFVTNPTDNMLGAWSTFLTVASVVTLGVFCAAMLVSLVYSKRMARPLDEMAAASR